MICEKKKVETHLNRGSPHKRMLVSPQNTWAENTSCRCWIRKSCQRDCSSDFDKLVPGYKTCNKTPIDEQNMIYKRDQQERNRFLSNRSCKIHLPTQEHGTTRKKTWCTKLSYSMNVANAFQRYSLFLFITGAWYLLPDVQLNINNYYGTSLILFWCLRDKKLMKLNSHFEFERVVVFHVKRITALRAQ